MFYHGTGYNTGIETNTKPLTGIETNTKPLENSNLWVS